MSILVGSETRAIVQGITGKLARFHTRLMLDYGTRVLGGVVPGKGGGEVEGVPVFDTVAQAVAATRAQASLIAVPPPFAADAILEAAASGIGLAVCITEGIPAQDMIRVKAQIDRVPAAGRMLLIGPNCPGVISPGKALLGVLPAACHIPGPVGVVSRSGTLAYEVASQLRARGIGISSSVGIGGDAINGASFADILARFEADSETRLVCLIGEAGGPQEAGAAAFVRSRMSKPVVASLAGPTGQERHGLGHAEAILAAFGTGDADEAGLDDGAGVTLVDLPSRIGAAVERVLMEAER